MTDDIKLSIFLIVLITISAALTITIIHMKCW